MKTKTLKAVCESGALQDQSHRILNELELETDTPFCQFVKDGVVTISPITMNHEHIDEN